MLPLTNITSSPADITSKYQPHPEAKPLLQPGQSPGQYTQALQKGNFSQDHIQFLAHGMPPRQSVGWACQSSAKVSDKLEPSDKNALTAAQNWVKNPTPANQSLAAQAAAKTNYQGPGAWAAQGAASANTNPQLSGHAVAGSVQLSAAKAAGKMPTAPTAPAMPTAPTLPKAPTAPTFQAPKAPTLQAPTMPQAPQAPKPPTPPTPAERAQMAKIHQPFIDLGHGIASGQKPFI